MPSTPHKTPTAELSERLARAKSSATKPALALRTNDRVSFCTPPTLQVPATPKDRSAKIRADASARFEREKRRRASSMSASKALIPDVSTRPSGPAERATLGGPSAKKGRTPPPPPPPARAAPEQDKENSTIAAVEAAAPCDARLTEGSRWSSTSLAGASQTRDDFWSAALDAKAWEEPAPPAVAALEADLVDKMVWAPVGAGELPGRVRKVWLDEAGSYRVGVELLQDHAEATSTQFPCLSGRGVAMAPAQIRLLSWQDLCALPPPAPPPPACLQQAPQTSSEGTEGDCDPSPLLEGRTPPAWAERDALNASLRRQDFGAPPTELGAGDEMGTSCDLADVFGRASLAPRGYRETGDWTADSWDLKTGAV